jgi:hypothetical protein
LPTLLTFAISLVCCSVAIAPGNGPNAMVKSGKCEATINCRLSSVSFIGIMDSSLPSRHTTPFNSFYREPNSSISPFMIA